jgi:hypothetical protein
LQRRGKAALPPEQGRMTKEGFVFHLLDPQTQAFYSAEFRRTDLAIQWESRNEMPRGVRKLRGSFYPGKGMWEKAEHPLLQKALWVGFLEWLEAGGHRNNSMAFFFRQDRIEAHVNPFASEQDSGFLLYRPGWWIMRMDDRWIFTEVATGQKFSLAP